MDDLLEMFALGYEDGFDEGCPTPDDDVWTDQEREAYYKGYWAGVSAYSRTLDTWG
jgi:hypothetical protein